MELSNEQLAIDEYIKTETGSLTVDALAGCGKTFTIINVITKRIYEMWPQQTVAMMAFNKSIAQEFEEKLSALRVSNVTSGTVHSFGFGALRTHMGRVKVDGSKVRWIVKDKLEETRKRVFDEHNRDIIKLVSLAKQSGAGVIWDETDETKWKDLMAHYGVDVEDEGKVIEACIEVLWESWEQDKWRVDFDDMISSPLKHKVWIPQYDWVIIDEAQDTNAVRRELALKMLKSGGRMVIVGDPRQAIYGFTGADSDSMRQITERLDSVTMPLTLTFRCPKAVVAVANSIVPELKAHESNGEGSVRTVNLSREWFKDEGIKAGDAVLCRNTRPLVEQAYNMIKAGVGCRVEGRDIGEGLIQLATKWSSIKTLSGLIDKVKDWGEGEVSKLQEKGKDMQAQATADRVECIVFICEALLSQGKRTVREFEEFVRELFGDTGDAGVRKDVPVLSTVHKSKGREWDRVFVLEKSQYMPSRYARKDWELEQEENLIYVAVTRSKNELVFLEKMMEEKEFPERYSQVLDVVEDEGYDEEYAPQMGMARMVAEVGGKL